ncbi:MAG TPA: hypothetical protein VFW47_14740 [Phenylobacterium sp.]|nr:hypothetical protein [Phenylobacterium sp.]
MSPSHATMPFQVFPFFFVGGWLLVSLVLSAMSGWLGLARQYPNRPETAVRTLHMLSGTMGLGVQMNGILRLSVCPSGLRVGLLFLFAAFSRDFLVPWSEIKVARSKGRWFRSARLTFGDSTMSRLTISARTADDLAAAAGRLWPEDPTKIPGREPTVV